MTCDILVTYNNPMDEDKVFKALADTHRRHLLDLLFERDGRTLSELETQLPMTRFGVMKHLDVLQEAGLITTKKVGREKHHFLNAVPIQQVYDRWVRKYAQFWARSLVDLKLVLEESSMSFLPDHVFQIFIRATPERIWEAITNGEITNKYYFNTMVQSSWVVGAPYHYKYADGNAMISGDVLEVDPPRKLVTTFKPLWFPDASLSKVTWEIMPFGPTCRVTVTHSEIPMDNPLPEGIKEGWAQILSGLKTYIETGEVLVLEPN